MLYRNSERAAARTERWKRGNCVYCTAAHSFVNVLRGLPSFHILHNVAQRCELGIGTFGDLGTCGETQQRSHNKNATAKKGEEKTLLFCCFLIRTDYIPFKGRRLPI